jgi:SAM-dependent methyltransferase
MSDTIERFSNRVENYIKYRPDYPREIIPFLEVNCGLTKDSVVADIGCGPGVSSRMFVERGNPVIGVEPNAAMRAAAEKHFRQKKNFSVVDGTAERTSLADASVDLVTAAQAFHWFDQEKAVAEFRRILKPGGWIVVVWNERQLDTTPFLSAYESFICKYAADYDVFRHENITAEDVRRLLGPAMRSICFANRQVFDFEGLKGRLLSSSYMPTESNAVYDEMIDELRSLFAKHLENDTIKVFYDTNVYYSPR